MKRFVTLLSAILLMYSGQAQAPDSTAPQKPQLKLSLNYNSHLNFYGRTDSLRSSGLFPMAELWVTPRFYVNAAPVFVSNALTRMDYAGTITTAGYQYMDAKWLTHLYLSVPFYEAESRLVQSALKAQGGFTVTALNKLANLTVGGDVKRSDRTDFGATAGLDRVIRRDLKDGSVLVLDPSFYAYAGTQQFSRSYTRKKSGFLLFPGNEEQVTEETSRFNILAYEASLPVIWMKKHWQVLATPSYILPQNLLTVPGRPELSETGKNTFYLTMGVKYTF